MCKHKYDPVLIIMLEYQTSDICIYNIRIMRKQQLVILYMFVVNTHH